MRRIFLFCFLLGLIAGTAARAQAPIDVTILVDDGYPPFSYEHEGRAKGVYVKVLRAIFARMPQFRVTLRPVPWQRGKLMMERGEGMGLAPAFFHGHDWPYLHPYSLPFYVETIRAALKEEFGYKNDMQIPRLEKIVLNIGCGAEAVKDSKKAKSAQEDLTAIAGQQAVVTRAKKSIAGFRVREDMPLGAKVTLRGERMYEFLDRLITIAMPRIRDFRGVSGKSFDGRGNYAMGLKEHIVFPEIDFDKVDETWGMDIVITTTAKTDAEAKALLKHFNMPFNS